MRFAELFCGLVQRLRCDGSLGLPSLVWLTRPFLRFGGCCVGFGWEVWLLGGRGGSEVETRGKAAAVFNQLPSSQL